MRSAAIRRVPFGPRRILLALGTVFGPLLFMSAYLVVTRKGQLSFDLDFWALGVSVAIGLLLVWLLSHGARGRPFIVGGYLLVASLFLADYSLYFVCWVFGDSL
jgi:hypothetical protein